MTKRLANCPNCGARLAVQVESGEQTRCPACRAVLRASIQRRPARGEPTLAGRSLGEFRVLEAIGRGSLGVVYKAQQASGGRLAVVKTVPPQLAADRAFLTRFYAEARAAAKLSHPNVAAMYAVGVAEGLHYVAMQHVDGEGLDARLGRGEPLEAGEALEILKQVVAGLTAAHGRGITHGDIKPSAILVDPAGRAWLADVGVAKLTRAEREAVAPGAPPPLPLYTAPEVASGAAPSSRSDLYELGATAYHLVAGRPPFESDDVAELIGKHASATPPALGQAAPRADRRFTGIIDRLLRKNASARHSSAWALFDELNALGTLETGTRGAAAARTPASAPLPAAPRAATDGSGRRRTKSGAAVKTRQRAQSGGRRRAALIAGIACVAVVAIVGGIALARRRGGAGGGPARVVRQPTSAVASERRQREAAAQTCLSRARDAVDARDWRKAIGYLDLLESDYTITAFYEGSRAAVAALRREIAVEARKPPPPGPVVLRAADATIHGKARYETGAGKDNIGFWSSDDDWVSWDFEAAAGAYEVIVDLAGEQLCDGNEYAVIVGDQRVIGTVRATGGWTTFVAETIGTLTLAKGGRHILEVRVHKRKSALMNLRSVALRPIKKPR